MSVTLERAKQHLRYESDDENDLIQLFIDGSKQEIEGHIGAAMGEKADAVESLEAAQLLIIGHWFANRESVVVGSISNEIPMSAMWLLERHRMPTLR